MSNIIPFSADRLPAYLKKAVDNSNDLMQGASPGIVRLSIEGSRWTIVRGKDDKTPIRHPKDPELFAASVNLIIVKASPNLARNFFARKFEKGVDAKPDCFSTDGIRPNAQSTDKQCATCAACRHAVYGTGENGKGFRCANFRNLVVAFPDNLEEPMLLRVPGGSLKNLAIYAKDLADTGSRAGVVLPYHSIVTKVRFDPNETGQKLLFAPAGMLDDETFARVDQLATSTTVSRLLGTGPVSEDALPSGAQAPSRETIARTLTAADEDGDEAPKPAPRAAAPAVAAADEDENEAPSRATIARTLAAADEDEDEAPKPRSRKAAPVAAVADEDEAPKPRSRKAAKPAASDDEAGTPFGADFDDLLGNYDD